MAGYLYCIIGVGFMVIGYAALDCTRDVHAADLPYERSTRDVEAFLKKTAIAYHLNSRKSTKFWRYAIAVFFKNASTARVQVYLQDKVTVGT